MHRISHTEAWTLIHQDHHEGSDRAEGYDVKVHVDPPHVAQRLVQDKGFSIKGSG